MNKRKVQEINASSMADIAFLLLIFFLVTTTMSVDKGLSRRLPKIANKDQVSSTEVNDKDIFQVLINSQNQLLVEGSPLNVEELREKTKEFILNKNNDITMPDLIPEKFVIDGKEEEILITKKHVISLQTDRGTEYQKYIEVQNELVAAYNEIRDEFSNKRFGVPYAELDVDHQQIVQDIYPQKISEAEPKVYGGKK